MTAQPKQPFAYKAAQIAFVCPFLAIVFSFCLTFALNNSSGTSAPDMIALARTFGLFIGIALYVTSLITGTIALLAIPRLGKRDLLARPLIGMFVSLAILAIMGTSLTREPITVKATRELAGDWYTKISNNGQFAQVQIHLDPNATATWSLGDGPAHVSLHGAWRIVMKDSGPLTLLIKFDADAKVPGDIQGIAREIVSYNANTLTLATKDGEDKRVTEIYTRTAQ